MTRVGLMVGAGLLVGMLGCEGGQTGDIGTDLEGCCITETEMLTIEAGAILDPDLDSVFEAAFDGAGARRTELMLFGPPSLWTDRGLEAPSDRATPIVVTLTPTGEVKRQRSKPDPNAHFCGEQDFCSGEWTLIVLAVAIELPEFGATHEGTGELLVRGLEVVPTIDFLVTLPELDVCGLSFEPNSGRTTIRCVRNNEDMNIEGSSTCLDRSTWVPLPRDPRSGLDAKELLERGLSALPLDLHCASQGAVLFSAEHFSARIPDLYCPDFAPPAIVRLDSPVVEDGGELSDWVDLRTDALCGPRECTEPDGCPTTFGDESEIDSAPRCTRAELIAHTGKSLHDFWVQVEDDGTMVVAARVFSIYDAVCHGQRLLD